MPKTSTKLLNRFQPPRIENRHSPVTGWAENSITVLLKWDLGLTTSVSALFLLTQEYHGVRLK
jgi:hypothetical protein